ncbi:ankyrin repeat protein [Nitrospirillum bahiense]|uniref:Ankyrin repeat protein n=2 Tax=Nitrospirillum amazonense TaxID=28077 RepID=A0A560FMU2_9PROT|nr:ankyrin repeat protein [Nitrospirillum amazonense]
MLARLAPLAAALLLMCAPLGVQAAVNAGEGPSFNCAAAATTVEKAICGDAPLAALDRQVDATYRTLLATAGKWKDDLALTQRLWLRQRADCFAGSAVAVPDGPGITCLAREYAARLDSLRAFAIVIRDDPGSQGATAMVVKWTYAGMLAAPRLAEGLFRKFQTAQAKAGLVLVLRLTTQDPSAYEAEIQQLLDEIASAKETEDFHLDQEFYDGSVASLAPFVRAAAGPVELPCGLFEREPDLFLAVRPMWGGGRDNFLPSARCGMGREVMPSSVAALAQALSVFDGGGFDRCTGSLRIFYGRHDAMMEAILLVAPRRLLDRTATPNADHDLATTPLQGWAYLSPWNRRQFDHIQALFLKARGDLAEHYRARYGLTLEEARQAAQIGMNERFEWTTRARPEPLAVAIMDADARPSLAEVLASGLPPQAAGAEPPLSLAVIRPAALAPLLAAGAPVDAVNAFGKTPLMTAAQFNAPDVVRALLTAKAAVNQQSLAPDRITDNSPLNDQTGAGGCGTYAITHGQRTALMYAAANAGLPVIEALLAAGADTALKDSTGLTALDYLEGRGPVPANPLLTGAELATAQTLLIPRRH